MGGDCHKKSTFCCCESRISWRESEIDQSFPSRIMYLPDRLFEVDPKILNVIENSKKELNVASTLQVYIKFDP